MTTVAAAAETRNKSQKQNSTLTSTDKDAHSQPSTRHSTKMAFETETKTSTSDSSLSKGFRSATPNSNGCTSLHQPSSLPPKKNLLQRSNPIDQPQVPLPTSQESSNSIESSCSKDANNDGSANLFKTFEETSKTSLNDDSLESETTEDDRNFVIPPSILEDKVGENENEGSDDCGAPQHTPGDLVWARVSGYPWWPSMVTNDPIQNMFFKVASTASKKCLYHVQFFGSVPERAWINWKNLVKYEDISQFDTLPTNLNVKAKGKKSGKSEKNEVPPSKKLWWEDSIKEANEAKLVDKYIRLDKYLKFKQTDHIPDALFSPTLPLRPKRESLRKRECTTNPEGALKCDTPTKRLKNDPDFIQAIFDLYKSRHLLKAKQKFPHYDDDDLEAFLLLQWKNLDQKIKDKYKKRYENPNEKDSGDETDPGDEETLINRARPLRKCVLTLSTNVYKGTTTENNTTEEASKGSGPESPNKTQYRKTPPINVPNATTASTTKRGRGTAPTSNTAASSSSENQNNSLVIIPEIGLRSPIPILNDEEALEQANAEGHMDDEDEEITGCPAARKEFICKVCETSGELLLCEGSCSGAFHLGCLGLDDVPEGEFKCDECTTGLHSCFVCRRNNGNLRACGIMYCGKFYHEECLRHFPLARLSFQGELICPLHACASCGFHNRKSPDVYHGKMYRCVRCPVAYHCGETDACLAAGCAIIAPNSIICCKHFMPVKNNKTHSHINVSWCFVCSQGGSLLCCERCPASFHLRCIGLSKLPKDETWYCNSCRLGLRPRYGDILWVKVQNYRWWPAEVIFPRMIPQKSMEEPHQVGEFIVQLFATKEFHWVHIGRTFLFHENDKNFHEPGEKQYPRNFQQALEKASEILIKRKRFAKQSALPIFDDYAGLKATKAADLLQPPELPETDNAANGSAAKRDVDSTGLPLLNQPSAPTSRSNTPLLAIAGSSSPPLPLYPTKQTQRKPGVKPRAQGANFFKTSPSHSASPMKRAKGRPKGSGKKQQQQLVAAAAALMAQIPMHDASMQDSDMTVNHSFDEATQKLVSAKNTSFHFPRKSTYHSEVKVLPRKDLKTANHTQHNPKITNISPPCSPIKADFECYQQQKAKNMEPLIVLTESKNSPIVAEPQAPATYKLVYQNSPFGNVQVYSADITEITPCECKATDPDPCGPTSDCWNRLLCVECHPQVCRAGERCSNQRFQKAQYPRFEIVYTTNRGYGLKTKAWIKKGDFVNEYCGDLIDIDECQKRLQFQNDIGDLNFYFCVLDKERIIDAGPKGNFSRFMNHSCDPNCETQKWTVNGDIRVGLFALADISPGTELTFNYNMDCLGNSKLKCKCNSPSCSGYIGMKPLKGASNIDRDRKKRRHKKEKAVDICYRCSTAGVASEMISCGRSFCGKFYHKKCLKPEELQPPLQQGLNNTILSTANFECPLHVCDICSKVAVYICSQCDHSTCQEHEKGVMYELDDHTFRCKYHYHLLIEKSRPDIKNNMDFSQLSTSSNISASGINDNTSMRSTSPSASLSHASSGVGGGGGSGGSLSRSSSSSQKMYLAPPSYQLTSSHHSRAGASPHQHALSSLSTMAPSSLDSSYLQKLSTASFSSHSSSREHSDQLSLYMNQQCGDPTAASMSNNLTASRIAAAGASTGSIDLEKFAAAAAAAGIIPVTSQLTAAAAEVLSNEAMMGGGSGVSGGSGISNAQLSSAAAASIRQMQQQQQQLLSQHNKQHSSASSATKFLTSGDSLLNAVLDSRRSSAANAAAASSLAYQSSFSNSIHQNPTSPKDIHLNFNNR